MRIPYMYILMHVHSVYMYVKTTGTTIKGLTRIVKFWVKFITLQKISKLCLKKEGPIGVMFPNAKISFNQWGWCYETMKYVTQKHILLQKIITFVTYICISNALAHTTPLKQLHTAWASTSYSTYQIFTYHPRHDFIPDSVRHPDHY